ncbi:MAG: 3-oxoacyl-acyl-carrier-protein synthase II [bacterium]|nr:MAG: 3-oxoacyl-acyl-carrier-protein synthase II [bacterium]
MKRRVVVTGLGAVTPLGIGAEKTWKALCAGKSGIGRISRFDTTNFQTKIAGEVKDFDPEDFLDKKQVRRMDSFVHYCMASTIMAMEDSKLEVANQNAERIGVLIGTGLGGLPTLEKNHTLLLEGGPKKISPFFIPMMIANMAPGQVAIHFGIKGPNICVVTACAAGSHAIGDSYKIIQRGDADIMVTGGTEATITPLNIGGFNAMKAISTHNDEPEKASRPFDKNRDGFVPAEGAGTIILEEMGLALKRGANIYAEIVGYGLTGDAFHITAPDPQGSGAARCMKMALLDANILPSEVDYINAHGTSTPLNDTIETIAIKSVFNEYSKKIPVSSTKSMTGHLLGAAGGVEAVFTILTIRDGIIPPTINYETPDLDCDLDYVPNVARKTDVKIAISNSFGFGGTNATLVFKRFEG